MRKDCVPSVELRRRLCLSSTPALQRRLPWFDRAARRPDGELIKDLPLHTPPRTWRKRTEKQLKTWATTFKVDVEPRVLGYARWRKDWVKVFSEIAQDRQACSDVVNSVGDTGSNCPGRVNMYTSTSE